MVSPLAKTCEVMDGMTKGHLAFDVPFVDRKNEIGRIARSLQVFKDHLVETTRLRIEQDFAVRLLDWVGQMHLKEFGFRRHRSSGGRDWRSAPRSCAVE